MNEHDIYDCCLLFYAGLTKVAFLLYNNLGEFLLPQQISSITRAAGSTKLESDAEFEDGDGFAKAGNGMSMTTMMMIENATTVLQHKKIIKTIVNSKIISASVGNADVTPLNEPVIYTLKHLMVKFVYFLVFNVFSIGRSTDFGYELL